MAANMIGVNKRIIVFGQRGREHGHVQPEDRQAVRALMIQRRDASLSPGPPGPPLAVH